MAAQMNGSQDPEFDKHHQEQIAQIHSDFNRHVTREKLGREPTDNELAMNFILNGGAKRLAIENNRDIKDANL